jgi:hypothetical protein
MTQHSDEFAPVDIEAEYGIPVHPEGDKFDGGDWEHEGHCICGQVLPPQREWHDAGCQWQHVRCPACRTLFVDEDDFTAIYEPSDEAGPCCHREETSDA